MQVLIDNPSGTGSVDYTNYVQFGKQASITRALNKPTLCTLPLLTGVNGLPLPPQLARVQILDAFGALLFTGYVTGPPASNVVGEQDEQALYLVTITAVSDEVLLDANQAVLHATWLGQTAQQSWGLIGALAPTPAQVALAEEVAAASRVEVQAGARWSENAGLLAGQTRSAYRAIANTIQVAAIGETTHAIAANDPGLHLEATPVTDLRWLARDITICGGEEPTAYVTELFQGDGVTTKFALSEKPFSPATRQKSTLLELFQGSSLNASIWSAVDPGSHLALTAAGLTCNGGTGRDAETTLASLQQIELGGLVTIEGGSVQITAGSAGIVLGLYAGTVNASGCFAGFQVSSVGATTTVKPMVNGSPAGSSFAPQPGHLYTFRLRIYSPEMERVRQSYFSLMNGASDVNGGDLVASAGQLEFEIQDVTSGAPGAPTLLFSGGVSSLPAAAVLGLIDSGSLQCSVRSVSCTQTGSIWVTVAPSGGNAAPQFNATAVQGGACHVTTDGNVEFYPATIPAVGSLIQVNYRAEGRAVARRALSAGGTKPLSSTETWIGTVDEPAAWSSTDCDNAAAALLNAAAASPAAMQGTYKSSILPHGGDIWPGDALLIGPQADGTTAAVIVREVSVTLPADTLPVYTVRFANEYAESLAIKLSTTIPLNTVLPQQPTTIAGSLASLSGLTVVNVSGSSLNVNAGTMPPVNGGFEVRRRDGTFGPGTDSDLVLRSPTANVSVPRLADIEQFYFRMYDGAVPPNYSMLSAAVFVNVPM